MRTICRHQWFPLKSEPARHYAEKAVDLITLLVDERGDILKHPGVRKKHFFEILGRRVAAVEKDTSVQVHHLRDVVLRERSHCAHNVLRSKSRRYHD
jgi:hypothetical protein